MNAGNGSPRAEPGIGRRLERAREERGLSVRQAEESTKIRARYLRELELENFDVLPAVYVLGSLKTYADFLGLDGAALSRELREHLEPDEPEVLDAREPLDADDEYEAVPVAAVGFNQLFLGMGVLLISVLAIMTLVSAVARYEEPKISQLDEPSVQEAPPEMDLAVNMDPERDPEPEVAAREQRKSDNQSDQPDQSKQEDGADREDEKPEEASSPASLFGDVKFVPMSPSTSSFAPEASSSASAAASTTASASASAPATPAGPRPVTGAAPADDAFASPSSASAAPASSADPAPASSAPSSGPADDAAPAAGGGEEPYRATPGGSRNPARVPDADQMAAGIRADVEEDLREDGIFR